MKIKQAKEYFDDGMITGFAAVRDPLVAGGWLLSISGKNGKCWTLDTALGEQRSFAKIETLISQVEAISGRVSSFDISV